MAMRIMKITVFVFSFISLKGMQPGVPKASELINAAERGDCAAIKQYKAAGGDINATECGYSALMKTVLFGHDAAAKLLLQLGANPDFQDQQGETILFYSRCNKQVFKAALLAKANPNIQKKTGKTALSVVVYYASDFSFPPYRIALLLKYGARADIPDNTGNTTRDYAANRWLEKYLKMDASELEKVIGSEQ